MARIPLTVSLAPLRATRRATAVALALLFLVSSGCAIVDNEDDRPEGFSVESNGMQLVMTNGLGERVYFFAVGRQLSFLIDWAPHLDDASSVAEGETVSVPLKDIMMNSDTGEKEIVVYWWRAAMRDGKRVPGDIEMIVVAI